MVKGIILRIVAEGKNEEDIMEAFEALDLALKAWDNQNKKNNKIKVRYFTHDE